MAGNGGVGYDTDIPAKEKAKEKSTRFYEKNENRRREKGITKAQAKGKESAISVRPHECGLFL